MVLQSIQAHSHSVVCLLNLLLIKKQDMEINLGLRKYLNCRHLSCISQFQIDLYLISGETSPCTKTSSNVDWVDELVKRNNCGCHNGKSQEYADKVIWLNKNLTQKQLGRLLSSKEFIRNKTKTEIVIMLFLEQLHVTNKYNNTQSDFNEMNVYWYVVPVMKFWVEVVNNAAFFSTQHHWRVFSWS